MRDVKDGSGKIWMDQVECTESDTDIRECTFSGWGKTNCDHAEDVGIMCETKWSDTPGRGKNDKKKEVSMTENFTITLYRPTRIEP